MSKLHTYAVQAQNYEAALQAIAQWASDRGALKGSGPMDVSDYARKTLEANAPKGEVDWSELRAGESTWMRQNAKRFDEFAADAREDFHEPDEQDIHFKRMTGKYLDNAGFPDSERHLVLRKGKEEFAINLADLLALAKYGSKLLLERYGAPKKGQL